MHEGMSVYEGGTSRTFSKKKGMEVGVGGGDGEGCGGGGVRAENG